MTPDIQELKKLSEETRGDRWVFAPPHTILALIEENERLVELLAEIGDKAHNASTGPAIPDAYWEIRELAYEPVRTAFEGVKK